MANATRTSLAGQALPLLMLASFIFGANAIAGKLAVGHVSPFLLTLARWGIASVILVLLARRQLRHDWPVIRANLPFLFALGAIGFSVFNGFLYTALVHTTAINVAILQAAMPLFIFLLNFLIFRTPTLFGQIIGYGLTLSGVVLLAAGGSLEQLAQLQFNPGDLIMIGAILTYAGYLVALRAKPPMHWLSFLAVVISSAALMAIPMAGFEIAMGTVIWPSTVQGWSVIAYAAIFPSIVAQGFYIRGVELLGGNRAGLFLNLVPVWGSLLSVMFLGEDFGLHHGLALVLVVGGVTLAQRLSRPAALTA